ncbi:MAG: hypothetical protein IPJ12_03035 [Betaproteobacteria bacterium]|nr:hypothetical protein [Betaproteobacteria bacterium]
MANTRPTKISFFKAVYYCFLAIVMPQRFVAEETADNALLNALAPQEPEERALKLRHALFKAFQLVFASGIFGVVIGLLAHRFCGPASSNTIAALQIIGALILLWGTLAVRGWDIQTYGGVTLTERVNQWIYRFLYCCGTAVLVLSLSWPTT